MKVNIHNKISNFKHKTQNPPATQGRKEPACDPGKDDQTPYAENGQAQDDHQQQAGAGLIAAFRASNQS